MGLADSAQDANTVQLLVGLLVHSGKLCAGVLAHVYRVHTAAGPTGALWQLAQRVFGHVIGT